MTPLIIGILICITLSDILLANRDKIPNWHRMSRISLGIFFGIAFVIGSGEAFFRCCYAMTEGRLASNNWADRYFEENSYGYRDDEWNVESWDDKRTVLVLGDSIGVGWGIEDPDDRFTDVLQQNLGDDYAVINTALPGLSTMEQIEKLETFELLPDPDIVLLQYALNDIEGAALTVGLGTDFDEPPEIVQRSHLADYIYTRDINNVGFNDEFWEWQYNAYDHPSIWGAHEDELRHFANYTAERDIPVIAVLFPNMADPVTSIPYIDRVAQVLDDYEHISVMRLFDEAAAWGVEASTVSVRDSHPNEAFHRFVGEALYERYFADTSLLTRP